MEPSANHEAALSPFRGSFSSLHSPGDPLPSPESHPGQRPEVLDLKTKIAQPEPHITCLSCLIRPFAGCV